MEKLQSKYSANGNSLHVLIQLCCLAFLSSFRTVLAVESKYDFVL